MWGDHDVIFAGTDEVITFSHPPHIPRQSSEKARCRQPLFPWQAKEPGLYDMQDVIG